MDRGHAACGRTDAISDPRLHPEYFPTLGCSGQSSLPEDSVEVELDLMAQKGSMDGNVSRPANQGVQPRRFYRSRNGWSPYKSVRRVADQATGECANTAPTASAHVVELDGAASKDQLEEVVADESLGLLDHYRIIRGARSTRA